jgi:glycolate oxidase
MEMPVPNRMVLDQTATLVDRLEQALGADSVIHAAEELRAYECDALTAYRCPPLAVVLPRTTEEVAAAMRICADMGVPIVPRGAGTSLAGGSLPTADSVILGVARLNKVLLVDYTYRVI